MLLLSLCFLIPGIATMIITGKTDGNRQQMGIRVILKDGNEIDGEQFVIGMAASELSYIKEKEALKAWMIVCRTNFLKAVGNEKKVKEQNLSLDYISMEEMKKNNGKKAWLELNNQLEEASEETFFQVLCYGKELADALYHQVSIGKTVSAKEVYNISVPYLTGIDSSQDVESVDYMDIKLISYKECVKKLQKSGQKETEKTCKEELKIKKQTENGYVQKVATGSNEWTGEEWKEIFGLNSTNFYLEDYGGRLRIVTMGKGHGMGMSLYGVNALEEKGLKATTLLSYYYPGTSIRKWEKEK